MMPLLNIKTVLLLIFFILIGWGVKAQTCDSIMGGSYFEAFHQDGRNFWELSATKEIVPCGKMSTPLPFAQDNTDFGTKRMYGVVNNPHNVNDAFMDIDEPMMIISGVDAGELLLSYTVSGLTPSTMTQWYSVTMEGYFLNDISSSCISAFQYNSPNFKYEVSIDGSSSKKDWKSDESQWKDKFTYTNIVERVLKPGETGLSFEIRTGNQWDPCLVLGISKIEFLYVGEAIIKKIKIISSEGDNVCRGELVRLELKDEYNATTYKWEKSPNGTDPWTPIGNNAKTILEEIKTTAYYRCSVNSDTSEVLKIAAISCCDVGQGVTSSRRIIYHDNFGTFSSPTDYTDAFGKKGKNTIDWKTCLLDNVVPGHTCYGEVNGPGTYIVGALGVVGTLGPINIVPWYSYVVREDASGDPKGGALFIDINEYHEPNNPPYYGEIYRQRIDNICSGVKLWFEVSMLLCPSDDMPNITIRLLKTGGALLREKKSPIFSSVEKCGWVKIRMDSITTNETSVVLSIVSTSTSGWTSGGDLMMDDIILRVCSPPVAELYSDLPNLVQDAAICDKYNNGNITLAIQTGELMSRYYDNPRFLFQRSPNVYRWENISGITSESYLTHDVSSYTSGTYTYFRVLVGSESELNKFIANPRAEDDTNCRTVSISNPIKIYVDELLTGKIEAKSPMCEGDSIPIKVGVDNADVYSWTSPSFDGEKNGAVIEPPSVTTTYNLYMRRGECEWRDSIFIEVYSKPVIMSIDSIDRRDKEIVFTPGHGTSPFKYGVDSEQADNNPLKYNLSYGTHSFYIIDSKDCRDVYDYVLEIPKLFPPIYFSPNGDGVKDTWEVPNIYSFFPYAEVFIYDRFGKLITKYKSSAAGWDGTYKGKPMPSTDYWYLIELKEIDIQYIGHFTLLRR